MTKIHILNVGSTNKGNHAIVESTIETIKTFVPDTEFYLMGPYERDHNGLQIKKQIGVGLSIRKPHYTIMSLLYLFKWFWHFRFVYKYSICPSIE
jgi:polysaccharide pyruvyl transferase WcaK-like protein